MPMAAAIGMASSDTTTASTKTSAWIRSVVRTSGSRPSSRSRVGHLGRRTVKVSIAASSARQWVAPR